jgi:hypothetical protein
MKNNVWIGVCALRGFGSAPDPSPRRLHFLGASLAMLISIAVLTGAAFGQAQTSTPPIYVLTAHNDLMRDGLNAGETILTPGNVNSTQFGKLFSQPIAGGINAQPLYVQDLTFPNGTTHNVVFLGTTTAEMVYAFDADTNGGANANPLWSTSLLKVGTGLQQNYGISGTPVIDLNNKTLYVVSSEIQNGNAIFRLHALSILTGAEQPGSPVLIQASVPGAGTGSINGVLTFSPAYEFQRPGLLLLNGILYVAFGSIGDNGPWHGWLFSFQESTLKMLDVFCPSAYGSGGGIWMSGAGLAAEVNNPNKPYGRMFVTTANGGFGILPPTVAGIPYSNPQNLYGMSVLDLDLSGGQMTVEDLFAPHNWAALNNQDGDLGSGAPILLPTQTLASGKTLNPLVQVGKTGIFYVLDRDNNNDLSNNPATEYNPAGLGGFNASGDAVVQEIQTPIVAGEAWGEGVWGAEAYWNGNIYAGGTNVANSSNTGGTGNPLTAYSFVNGVLSSNPTSTSAQLFTFPGPTPSVSSSGNTNGIVWLLKNDALDSSGWEALQAYDATNLAKLLYTSDTNLARDNPGYQLAFNVPTIANGKVYVGSQSPNGAGAQFSVYGLLADTPVAAAPVISPAPNPSQTFPLTVTISGPAGATIYYTTNGSRPTSSSQVYSSATPISVSTDETITAISSVTGFLQSPPATATYVSTAIPSVPSFSLAAGTYSGPQTLNVSESEAGAIVYYTTDGSTPTTSSPIYAQPLSITASETVQAFAVGPGGIPSAVASAVYTILPNYSINFPNGFTEAQGPMKFNGSTDLDDFRLQLTNGEQYEAGSAFFATPVNIQSFTTSFTFQLSNPNFGATDADGITFTIQNNSPSALGGVGGDLGYGGIPNSVAIKFDLYNNAGEGSNSIGIYTDGAAPMLPAINLTPSGVNLHSGDYMNVTMIYNGITLTMTITDAVTLASFTQSFAINIHQIVGSNTAYVGFTGGTGTLVASQKLTAWTFISGPPAPSYASGFAPGGLTLNGGAIVNGTNLQLTDGNPKETRSAFFTYPVNIQQFSAHFQFQIANGNADGFTFTIQGDSPTAIGAAGGGLGYGGMPNSAAIKFDIYNNSGEGPSSTGLYLNGAGPATPAINLIPLGINLRNTDTFNVQITYVGTTLTVTITDMGLHVSATQIYNVNLPAIVGGPSAYVGFTGASGGETAIQQILNWSFTPETVTGPSFAHGFVSPLTQMTLNGGAVALANGALDLTDGKVSETRSAWYSTPVNVQQFTTSFDFQLTNANADGFTFAIQNDGLSVVGTTGGGLGYGGLPLSIAIKFDLFSNAGEGPDSTGVCINGLGAFGLSTNTTTDVNLSATGINLHSGDIFNVQMVYNGTNLTVVITDTVTNATAIQTYNVNIPAIVGGTTAYVGFTGASGGNVAVQNILNWSFAGGVIN